MVAFNLLRVGNADWVKLQLSTTPQHNCIRIRNGSVGEFTTASSVQWNLSSPTAQYLPKLISIRCESDFIATGPQSVQLHVDIMADQPLMGTTQPGVNISILDADIAGVRSGSDGLPLSVIEGDETSVCLRLTSRPQAPVTATILALHDSTITMLGSGTFYSDRWPSCQRFSFSTAPLRDFRDMIDRNVSLCVQPSSLDPFYNTTACATWQDSAVLTHAGSALVAPLIPFQVLNSDRAGLYMQLDGPGTTALPVNSMSAHVRRADSEAGSELELFGPSVRVHEGVGPNSTMLLSVRLLTEPSAPVLVAVEWDDRYLTAATVAGNTSVPITPKIVLRFDDDSWSISQFLLVRTADNWIDDSPAGARGQYEAWIKLSIATTEPAYVTLRPLETRTTVLEDDIAGFQWVGRSGAHASVYPASAPSRPFAVNQLFTAPAVRASQCMCSNDPCNSECKVAWPVLVEGRNTLALRSTRIGAALAAADQALPNVTACCDSDSELPLQHTTTLQLALSSKLRAASVSLQLYAYDGWCADVASGAPVPDNSPESAYLSCLDNAMCNDGAVCIGAGRVQLSPSSIVFEPSHGLRSIPVEVTVVDDSRVLLPAQAIAIRAVLVSVTSDCGSGPDCPDAAYQPLVAPDFSAPTSTALHLWSHSADSGVWAVEDDVPGVALRGTDSQWSPLAALLEVPDSLSLTDAVGQDKPLQFSLLSRPWAPVSITLTMPAGTLPSETSRSTIADAVVAQSAGQALLFDHTTQRFRTQHVVVVEPHNRASFCELNPAAVGSNTYGCWDDVFILDMVAVNDLTAETFVHEVLINVTITSADPYWHDQRLRVPLYIIDNDVGALIVKPMQTLSSVGSAGMAPGETPPRTQMVCRAQASGISQEVCSRRGHLVPGCACLEQSDWCKESDGCAPSALFLSASPFVDFSAVSLVQEAGGAQLISIQLASRPTAPVIVSIDSESATGITTPPTCSGSPSHSTEYEQLLFSRNGGFVRSIAIAPQAWNTPVTISIIATNDVVDELPQGRGWAPTAVRLRTRSADPWYNQVSLAHNETFPPGTKPGSTLESFCANEPAQMQDFRPVAAAPEDWLRHDSTRSHEAWITLLESALSNVTASRRELLHPTALLGASGGATRLVDLRPQLGRAALVRIAPCGSPQQRLTVPVHIGEALLQPAPTIETVMFSRDAARLVVRFTAAVSVSRFPSRFDCAQVLSPLAADQHVPALCSVAMPESTRLQAMFGVDHYCEFTSSRELSVRLGTSATVKPGDTIQLVTGSIRGKFTPVSQVPSIGQAAVVHPPYPIPPRVGLAAPRQQPTCGSLELTIRAAGMGGRPGRLLLTTVRTPFNTPTVERPTWPQAARDVALLEFLKNVTDQPSVRFPVTVSIAGDLLYELDTYRFAAGARSFTGMQSALDFATVTITSNVAPQIMSLTQPSNIVLTNRQVTQLAVTILQPPCLATDVNSMVEVYWWVMSNSIITDPSSFSERCPHSTVFLCNDEVPSGVRAPSGAAYTRPIRPPAPYSQFLPIRAGVFQPMTQHRMRAQVFWKQDRIRSTFVDFDFFARLPDVEARNAPRGYSEVSEDRTLTLSGTCHDPSGFGDEWGYTASWRCAQAVPVAEDEVTAYQLVPGSDCGDIRLPFEVRIAAPDGGVPALDTQVPAQELRPVRGLFGFWLECLGTFSRFSNSSVSIAAVRPAASELPTARLAREFDGDELELVDVRRPLRVLTQFSAVDLTTLRAAGVEARWSLTASLDPIALTSASRDNRPLTDFFASPLNSLEAAVVAPFALQVDTSYTIAFTVRIVDGAERTSSLAFRTAPTASLGAVLLQPPEVLFNATDTGNSGYDVQITSSGFEVATASLSTDADSVEPELAASPRSELLYLYFYEFSHPTAPHQRQRFPIASDASPQPMTEANLPINGIVNSMLNASVVVEVTWKQRIVAVRSVDVPELPGSAINSTRTRLMLASAVTSNSLNYAFQLLLQLLLLGDSASNPASQASDRRQLQSTATAASFALTQLTLMEKQQPYTAEGAKVLLHAVVELLWLVRAELSIDELGTVSSLLQRLLTTSALTREPLSSDDFSQFSTAVTLLTDAVVGLTVFDRVDQGLIGDFAAEESETVLGVLLSLIRDLRDRLAIHTAIQTGTTGSVMATMQTERFDVAAVMSLLQLRSLDSCLTSTSTADSVACTWARDAVDVMQLPLHQGGANLLTGLSGTIVEQALIAAAASAGAGLSLLPSQGVIQLIGSMLPLSLSRRIFTVSQQQILPLGPASSFSLFIGASDLPAGSLQSAPLLSRNVTWQLKRRSLPTGPAAYHVSALLNDDMVNALTADVIQRSAVESGLLMDGRTALSIGCGHIRARARPSDSDSVSMRVSDASCIPDPSSEAAIIGSDSLTAFLDSMRARTTASQPFLVDCICSQLGDVLPLVVPDARVVLSKATATAVEGTTTAMAPTTVQLTLSTRPNSPVTITPGARRDADIGLSAYCVLLNSAENILQSNVPCESDADCGVGGTCASKSGLRLQQSAFVFDASNWAVPQVFELYPIDDALDEPTLEFSIGFHVVSDDWRFSTAPICKQFAGNVCQQHTPRRLQLLTMVVHDNDLSAVTLLDQPGQGAGVRSMTRQVMEGEFSTLFIHLHSRPHAPVTLSVVSSIASRTSVVLDGATALKTTLPPSSWGTDLESNVALRQDFKQASVPTVAVQVTYTMSSADAQYHNRVLTLTLTVAERDAAALVIRPSLLLLEEAVADSTSFEFRLATIPTHSVSIAMSDLAPAAPQLPFLLQFTPQVVTIAPLQWNVPHTVMMSVANDSTAQGDQNVTVHAQPSSADPLYNALGFSVLFAHVLDNDVADVRFSPLAAIAVREGLETPYTLRLRSQPTAAVTISVSMRVPSSMTLPGSLIATPRVFRLSPGDWMQPVPVTITALDDDIFHPVTGVELVHSFASADLAYDNLAERVLFLSYSDNDIPGVKPVHSSLSLLEGDSNHDLIQLRLESQPLADVTVQATVVLLDAPTGSVTQSQLNVIPPSVVVEAGPQDWRRLLSWQLSVTDDSIQQVLRHFAVQFTVTSADGVYHQIPAAAVNVTIVDDDSPGVFLSISEAQVSEADVLASSGTSVVYRVRLTSQPTAPITIIPVSTGALGSQFVVSPAELVVSADADAYLSLDFVLRIQALDDDVDEGTGRSYSLSHQVRSQDARYDGILVAPVTVRVTDNDQAALGLDTTRAGTVIDLDMPDLTVWVRLETRPTSEVIVLVQSASEFILPVQPIRVEPSSNDQWRPAVLKRHPEVRIQAGTPPLQTIVWFISLASDPYYNGPSTQMNLTLQMPANRPPEVHFNGPWLIRPAQLADVGVPAVFPDVRLDASATTDPDNQPLSYQWALQLQNSAAPAHRVTLVSSTSPIATLQIHAAGVTNVSIAVMDQATDGSQLESSRHALLWAPAITAALRITPPGVQLAGSTPICYANAVCHLAWTIQGFDGVSVAISTRWTHRSSAVAYVPVVLKQTPLRRPIHPGGWASDLRLAQGNTDTNVTLDLRIPIAWRTGEYTVQVTVAGFFADLNQTVTLPSRTVLVQVAPTAAWQISSWSACSESCGNGFQTRTVRCYSANGGLLAGVQCPQPAPVASRSCFVQPCKPTELQISDWGPCSEPCGSQGTQTRSVICRATGGLEVDMDECGGSNATETLVLQQACNRIPCERFNSVPLLASCSSQCGVGQQLSFLACVGSIGTLLPGSHERCIGVEEQLVLGAQLQACTRSTCGRFSWKASAWSACSEECRDAVTGRSGQAVRQVDCIDRSTTNNTVVDDELCAGQTKPPESRACNQQLCRALWYDLGSWSACEPWFNQTDQMESCLGFQTRTVQCMEGTQVANASVCDAVLDDQTMPSTQRECTLCTHCGFESNSTCSGHGRCRAGTCFCESGYSGTYCEASTLCGSRAVSLTGECCPSNSSVLDRTGACCRQLDARGACCDADVDACGICGGDGFAVDVLGRCCTAGQTLDAAGVCCDGSVDVFGRCLGLFVGPQTFVLELPNINGLSVANVQDLSLLASQQLYSSLRTFIAQQLTLSEDAVEIGEWRLELRTRRALQNFGAASTADSQAVHIRSAKPRHLAAALINTWLVATVRLEPLDPARPLIAMEEIETALTEQQAGPGVFISSVRDGRPDIVCGNGICEAGEAVLPHLGFAGCPVDCPLEVLPCPSINEHACSGHGVCDAQTGRCQCFQEAGYTGDDCASCTPEFVLHALSGGCLRVVLQATCFDEIQNGREGGVDCGGVCATPCPIINNPVLTTWQIALVALAIVFCAVASVSGYIWYRGRHKRRRRKKRRQREADKLERQLKRKQAAAYAAAIEAGDEGTEQGGASADGAASPRRPASTGPTSSPTSRRPSRHRGAVSPAPPATRMEFASPNALELSNQNTTFNTVETQRRATRAPAVLARTTPHGASSRRPAPAQPPRPGSASRARRTLPSLPTTQARLGDTNNRSSSRRRSRSRPKSRRVHPPMPNDKVNHRQRV